MSNKILYISQEITPYMPANDMSEVSQKLPQKAQENGYEVRIFMPKYGAINERRNQLHEVIRLSGMNVIIDDTDHPLIIKVATLQPSRMQVYFIDSDDYFVHKSMNETEFVLFPEENDERLMFFAYGVIETVKKLRWEPRIVHCQGWVSSLAPMYIRTMYADDPMFKDAKIVYSLYGRKFEGQLNGALVDKLRETGIPADILDSLTGAPIDYEALSKLAIRHSDVITVIDNNVPESLIDYARSLGKEVVILNDKEDFEPILTAYNQLV